MKIMVQILLLSCLLATNLFGQTYSAQGLVKSDSLNKLEYPYILPIYGAAAHKLGYELPYSAGISVNYLWQESDLMLSNLQVGFNNGPMTNLDEVIKFDDAISASSSLNFRPDIWLFPFLNIYGILGKAKTSTEINAGIWLPDTSNDWQEVTSFSTKANFDAMTFGFGATPTFAYKGWWIALDLNVAWTDVSALNKPVFTFVFGPRFGKTYQLNNKDMNISFWFGGFRLKFSSETNGSLNLNEVMNTEELQGKVDQGFIRVDEAQTNVDTWWESLTPAQQQKQVNIAKYETAYRAIETTSKVLTSLDGALSNAETATVQYSLDKKNKNMWNFIIGSQFQINKHWMLRAEYGFLGSRHQFLTGIQYRFGL